jgi:hypothetical protein
VFASTRHEAPSRISLRTDTPRFLDEQLGLVGTRELEGLLERGSRGVREIGSDQDA